MPVVCTYKPNRSKRRTFTAKDVARIARYATKDGTSPIEIFGVVAAGLGIGYLLCLAARAIDTATRLSKVIIEISGTVALAKLLDFLVNLLTRGALRKIPIIQRSLAAMLIAIGVTENIIKLAKQFAEDELFFAEASEILHQACSRAREAIIESGGELGEKFNDTLQGLENG